MTLAIIITACGGEGATPSTTSDPPAVVTTTTTRSAEAQLTAITEIDDGDCFDTHVEASALIRAVWKVPCSDPHDYEVYAAFDYEGDVGYRHPAYPGETTVQDQAERRCYEGFEGFVGVRWTISTLDIRTWWPSEVSWSSGDRRIICTVTSTDRTALTGSQRGSAV